MGFRKITTGFYTDPKTGLKAECVAMPLSDKSKNTIQVKETEIKVNYEKLFYDADNNLMPEFTQSFSYTLKDEEDLDAWDSNVLPEGSSVGSAFQQAITTRMMSEQGIS